MSSTPAPEAVRDLTLARRILDPGLLELIVLPTEQCNFRCTYCYEDFLIGRMGPDTVAGLKSLIAARADGGTDLVLSWFGGEPLVAADIVLDVSSHAQALFGACGRGMVGHVTTNAYLLRPRLLDRLLAAGVTRYQITLDGPREVHDRTRLRRDGHGTFDRIWPHLLHAARHPDERLAVSLRLHYDGRSVRLLEPLVDDVIREFGGSGRFTVNLHELERLGGARDDEIVEVGPEGLRVVQEYAARLERAGLTTIVPAEGLADYVCYASRANSLIVRADGRLSKCTVALSDDYNTVGRLHPDGRVEIDHDRLRPWLRGLASGDREELVCPNVGFPVEREPVPLLLGPTRTA